MTYKKSTNDNTQQTISPLVDIESLSSFFIDVTEYIHDNQHGEGGTVTAQDIANYAMKAADSQDSALLKSYSEMIDLMADLGWLDIHALGTTLGDELLYEFNPIKQGGIDA